MTSVIVKERETGHRSTIVSVREHWKGRTFTVSCGSTRLRGLRRRARACACRNSRFAGYFTVSGLFTIISFAGAGGDSC